MAVHASVGGRGPEAAATPSRGPSGRFPVRRGHIRPAPRRTGQTTGWTWADSRAPRRRRHRSTSRSSTTRPAAPSAPRSLGRARRACARADARRAHRWSSPGATRRGRAATDRASSSRTASSTCSARCREATTDRRRRRGRRGPRRRAARGARRPFRDRAAVFLRAADLLAGPWRARFAAATMLGQSKSAYQSEIDAVCELCDFLRFGVADAAELYARQPRVSPRGQWNQTDHRPLEGFVLAISPFNFTSIAANLLVRAGAHGQHRRVEAEPDPAAVRVADPWSSSTPRGCRRAS